MDRSLEQMKSDLTAYARSLGFQRLGVTSAVPLAEDRERLRGWLAEGFAGGMTYMESGWEKRAQPEQLLPGARSVVSLAASYFQTAKPGAARERWARYAWAKDYHKVLEKRLSALVRYLEALLPGAAFKTYVDTGPLLERAFARRSGLGFIGKNTMLITRGLGSWVFLAHVITTADLPSDAPDARSCGSCSLCIDACPTNALTEPFRLDARKCISYLTIEERGPIVEEKRQQVGSWVFGCDICQDVCPHNTRVEETTIPEFQSDGEPPIQLQEILDIRSDNAFGDRFTGSAIKRAKRDGLIRNACLVAANTGRQDLLPQLQHLAVNDESPVVRDSAAWAVAQLSA